MGNSVRKASFVMSTIVLYVTSFLTGALFCNFFKKEKDCEKELASVQTSSQPEKTLAVLEWDQQTGLIKVVDR